MTGLAEVHELDLRCLVAAAAAAAAAVAAAAA